MSMARQFLTIFWRDMLRFVRFRALLFSSLVQPALWMAFFGIAMSSNFERLILGGQMPPGAAGIEYLTFMAAGVIAMTTLFTSLFGGISLIFDKNWGLMREMLASPMPRSHIIFGLGLSGVTKSCIQVTIIIVFGMILGVNFFTDASILGVITSILGIFAFVAVFALGFLFLSSSISMRLESPEGVQALSTLLTMPLFFSSNALYPVESFPWALKLLSNVNPLTYLVTGVRSFAIGDSFVALGTMYSYTAYDILFAFGVLVVFAAVMFMMAWWTFKKAIVTG
jgi:ABC-2 type transport system permease protein